ncbi:MAG: EAL domain-containing protein [Cyanobacteria bacterium P01_F01_bin.150]
MTPKKVIGNPLRLLIIHQKLHIQAIYTELEKAGIEYYCDITQRVLTCEQLVATHHYDAVLCDETVSNEEPSGENALDIFRAIQKAGKGIPFIVLTTEAKEKTALAWVNDGITDYVISDRLFRLPMVLKRSLHTFTLQRQQQESINQLQQQARKETIISHILQAMRKTLVLEDILQTTLNQLQDALEVTRCLFLRFSEVDFRIRYIGETTPHRDQMYDVRCDLCNFYRYLLVNGQFVIIQEFDKVPVPAQKIAQDFSLSASILAPLIYNQRCLGLICLHQCTNDGERDWTHDEVRLVKAIANQCAIAVYQSELYSKAQQELEKREQVEAKLRYDAFHDSLTNLPNRTLLTHRLSHALERAKHESLSRLDTHTEQEEICTFAVLFIDLDHFKDINDSLGHLVGDRLLCDVAKRLESCIHSWDTIARLGGDEFVVLMEEMTGIAAAIEMAEHIHRVLTTPLLLDGQEIFINASIGIAPGCSHYEQSAQLLRDADSAMYRAKQDGRHGYKVFDESMHIQALQRLNLMNSLRSAIETQALQVYYQPIISLPNHQLEGFEALVRWHHPQQGLLTPDRFIAMAEETGLIFPLDLAVLEMACCQLRSLRTQFPHQSLTISVNFSGKELSYTDLMEQIDHILGVTGVDAAGLKLEITESSIMQNDAIAMEQLQQIKARNIELSIDDFGTGYSSLSYLQHLPVDLLKIDRAFIDAIDRNSTNLKIVETITNLAHSLNIRVVAEGVETHAQLEQLTRLQCEYAQGHLFAKPMPATEVAQFIRDYNLP